MKTSTPAEAPRRPRTPSLFLALLPIVVMLVLMSVGNVALKLPAEPLILASALVAVGVAVYLGYSNDDVMKAIADKIAKVTPAIFILITVGLMIGAWMAGGTIPMLAYYGLKIVSPEYLLITAFVVSSFISLCTGTSWGSAGTIGVAFMGVAAGMHANMAAVAGAVVAGAYFGDKLSPLSGTTNLAAMVTGVNLYTHIGHLLYTTLPSFIVTGGVMVIAGLSGGVSGDVTAEQLNALTDTLSQGFSMNPLLLVPVVLVLLGSVLRKPTIPVMLLSSVVAMANAVLIQHISFKDVVNATVNGFVPTMITRGGFDGANLPEAIGNLLTRGGMMSMMNTLLIAFVAISFAGIMSLTGSLDLLVKHVLRFATSTGRMICATIVTGLLAIGVTSNGQISILLPGEMLRKAYIKRGIHPKTLGRTIEDSGSIVEPILPWTAAGAYMAGTLGVATIEYLPWAVLCWTGMIFAIVWGFTGFGIGRLTPEEQAELLAEYGPDPAPEPSPAPAPADAPEPERPMAGAAH